MQANLLTALTNQLRGKRCRAYSSDPMVRTGPGYPDVSVSCTPFPDSETVVAEPVVIFEVLSTGIAGDDRTVPRPRERNARPD